MPAKIITVFNQKGGCGKSMITMQLAGTFGMRGYKVFVIDMDGQNTSALWFHQADAESPFPATVLSMAPLQDAFVDKMDGIMRSHDIIIVDCPPALGSSVPWASLSIADLALIPVVPVMDNVWATPQAQELVVKANARRKDRGIPEVQAALVLNMVKRGTVFDVCLEVLQEKALFPILGTRLNMLNIFPESQLQGSIATGRATGAQQINALADEVAAMLKIGGKK